MTKNNFLYQARLVFQLKWPKHNSDSSSKTNMGRVERGGQVSTHPSTGTKRKLPDLSSSQLCFFLCVILILSDWRNILVAENSNHHPSRSRKFQRTIISLTLVTCPHMSNYCGLKDDAVWLPRLWSHAHTCGLVKQTTMSNSPTRTTRYRKMAASLKKGSQWRRVEGKPDR